jgi:hypothetical protein
MSHNILYCNDETASPKPLQTTKIQIPDEDRIVKMAFLLKNLNSGQKIWKLLGIGVGISSQKTKYHGTVDYMR